MSVPPAYKRLLFKFPPMQVYMWQFGVTSSIPGGSGGFPAAVLKTRKSLRALHFHPLGVPLLLTAEVVERKSSRPETPTQRLAGNAVGVVRAVEKVRTGGGEGAHARKLQLITWQVGQLGWLGQGVERNSSCPSDTDSALGR